MRKLAMLLGMLLTSSLGACYIAPGPMGYVSEGPCYTTCDYPAGASFTYVNGRRYYSCPSYSVPCPPGRQQVHAPCPGPFSPGAGGHHGGGSDHGQGGHSQGSPSHGSHGQGSHGNH
jgi:hypothetical protein